MKALNMLQLKHVGFIQCIYKVLGSGRRKTPTKRVLRWRIEGGLSVWSAQLALGICPVRVMHDHHCITTSLLHCSPGPNPLPWV